MLETNVPVLPDTLRVTVDGTVRSPIELGTEQDDFWLPTLGPTAWVLALRLLDISAEGDGETSVIELMAELGVGAIKAAGWNNPLRRALERLCRFGIASVSASGGEVMIRQFLPFLRDSQYRQLTPRLRIRYDQEVTATV